MEPCPKCESTSLGTEASYPHDVRVYCRKCGFRGPMAPIDPDDELWLEPTEAEAKRLWDKRAKAPPEPFSINPMPGTINA